MKKLTVISALLIAGAMMFATDAATATDTKAAPKATTTTAAATTDTKAAPKADAKVAPKAEAKVAAPVASTLEGTVAKTVAADAAKKTSAEIVVIGADGKSNTFVVKAATKITGADGKELKLAQIVEKAKVKVTYTAGKAEVASDIAVL